MVRNTVHGNNFGVQAGQVNGPVTIRNGRVQVPDTSPAEDAGEVDNTVHGDNFGVQAGVIDGGITLG
jgi:hypothetical protein